MPPRRLLFVLHGAAFGGVERQAELLAQAAKSEGHRVSLLVICEDGPALSRFREHCESIRILNARISNDLSVWTALRRACPTPSEHDAAVIFNLAKFPVISNALRKAVPRQVLHVGNPVGATAGERWKQEIRSWLFPPSTALRLAANSRHTLGSLEGHPFYRRFPARVSMNCVSLPEHPVVLRDRCQPLRIGMVARLDIIKDHATLIRATALLKRRGVPIQCELIGRGAMEAPLKKLAEDEGVLADRTVEFTGWLSDVGQALRRWDIFVFSTTVQEGFGNAAAEAMAHGLPCVFTDVGPCREVGMDTVSYVPPRDTEALADRLVELAGDVALRQALGDAARARAETTFGAARKLADILSIAFTDGA